MKKKIAIILPDFSTGGAETMVAQFSSHLDFNKFEVYVIAIRKKLNNHVENMLSSKLNVIYIGKDKGFEFKSLLKLYKVLKKINPDLIHTHLQSFMYVIPYAIIHNKKIIHTIHNIPEKELSNFRKKILGFLLKKNKAIAVGISDTISEMIKDFYKINDCETVYNPVDIEKFKIDNTVIKEKNKIVTLISIGRFVEQKNQKLLIDSLIKLNNKNIKLVFLGDGMLKKTLEKYVKDNNMDKNIIFKGNVSNVNYELNKADIFVLSSVYEGLPMTILEAMACGMPIISTDVGGVKDIVTNNGIVVPSNNEDEMCNAINLLFNNKKMRDEMGKKSLENVMKYSVQQCSSEYEKVYYKYI